MAPAVPDVVASSVASFCEMAPGVPYSQQLLDDILEDLEESNHFAKSEDTPGFALIEVRLRRTELKIKSVMKHSVEARVAYKAGGINDAPPGVAFQYEHASIAGCKEFPFDREGMKAAIEFVKRTVQNLKRRGLCDQCLAAERPRKRLRVAQRGLCGECLEASAYF